MDRGLTSADPDDDEDVDVAGLVGRLIAGKYRVVRPIGSGSTGAVYVCQHVGLDKLVALKILHREMETNSSFVDQFKREARAASRLEHPNSVRVLDFGQESAEQGGALYIVMEYIEGRDLLQVLDEDGPFSAERAVNVMSQILDALSVAHNLGIVHRDLKPENILVRKFDLEGEERELVTVCDFGIALLSPTRLSGQTNAELVNASDDGMVVGTPAYMSPEQVRAEPQDSRSDIYSAGVVLFQLLTLQVPFSAETPLAVAVMHCSNLPPLPSEFGAVSPALEEICLKALSKAKADRYQSAREMRGALQRALQATPPPNNRLPGGRLPGAMRWAAARAQPSMVPPPLGNTAPSSILPTELAKSPGELGKGARMRRSVPLLGVGLVVIGMAAVPLLRNAGSNSIARTRRSAASGASRGQTQEHFVPPSAAVAASAELANAAANSGEATSLAGGKAAVDRDAAVLAYPAADVLARGEVAPIAPAVAAMPSVEDPFAPEVAPVTPALVAVTDTASTPAAAPAHALSAAPPVTSNVHALGSNRAEKKPVAVPVRKPVASAQPQVADVSAPAAIAVDASSMPPTAAQSQSELSIVKLESWSGARATEPPTSPAASEPPSTSQSTSLPRTAATIVSRKIEEPQPSLAPNPEHATVTTAAIVARAAVSRASVRGALNMDAITDCYRDGLRAGAAPARSLSAEIEIHTSMNGAVEAAELRAPMLRESLRHCIEQVARRGRVREVDTGAAQATVTLLFQPR